MNAKVWMHYTEGKLQPRINVAKREQAADFLGPLQLHL